MDTNFNCGHCGQNLTVDASGAGQLVDCPKCGNALEVPQPPQYKGPERGIKAIINSRKQIAQEDRPTTMTEAAPKSYVGIRLTWGDAFDLVWKVTICSAVIGLVFWVIAELIIAILHTI